MLLQLSVNASLKVNPNFILFQTLWRKSRKNVPGNTKKPIDDEILFFFKIDGIYLRQQIRLYIVQYGKHGVYTCAVAGAHGVVIASFIDGRSQRCICASFFLFFFFAISDADATGDRWWPPRGYLLYSSYLGPVAAVTAELKKQSAYTHKIKRKR